MAATARTHHGNRRRPIAGRPLDIAPAWWPVERRPDWRFENMRKVVLHVMAETARRARRLDSARELIDGRTRLVLTG